MLIKSQYFTPRIRRVLAFLAEDKGSGVNAPRETSMEISSKRIVDRVRKFGVRPIRATTRRHRFSLSLPAEPSPSHFRNNRVRILRCCQHRSFPAVSNPKERGDIAESVNYDPTARLYSLPLLHWYLFPLLPEGRIPVIIKISSRLLAIVKMLLIKLFATITDEKTSVTRNQFLGSNWMELFKSRRYGRTNFPNQSEIFRNIPEFLSEPNSIILI